MALLATLSTTNIDPFMQTNAQKHLQLERNHYPSSANKWNHQHLEHLIPKHPVSPKICNPFQVPTLQTYIHYLSNNFHQT